jgi:hypothetical protein
MILMGPSSYAMFKTSGPIEQFFPINPGKIPESVSYALGNNGFHRYTAAPGGDRQ